MPVAANGTLQALPISILLLFAILLVGVITLIYSHGNWRTTLISIGLASVVVLVPAGIYFWQSYLDTHFIGQFDSLGIPFRKAGPGWPILLEAWVMWLVPAGLGAILAALITWALFGLQAPNVTPSSTVVSDDVITSSAPMKPMNVIAKQLEVETLKRELTVMRERLANTIELAEAQLEKKHDLEIALAQLNEQRQEGIADLKDKINALNLEIEARETQNEELTALTLQQAEEILRLKIKISDGSN